MVEIDHLKNIYNKSGNNDSVAIMLIVVIVAVMFAAGVV